MKKVSKPGFWNKRYLDDNTGWDIGAPTPILTNYLKENKSIGKVCVLGCGNGHDALELARYNNDVYAVDFAKKGSEIIGGKGGGGRPDFAQAGGVDSSKIDEALDNLKSLI